MFARRSTLATATALCAVLFSLLFPYAAVAADREYAVDLVVDAQTVPTVDRGRSFTYTVFVVNEGPAVAQGVIVRTPLPMGLHFEREGSDAACSFDADENEVFCTYGSLGLDVRRSIPVVLRTAHQNACADIEYVLQSTVESLYTDAFPLSNTTVPVRTRIRCVPIPPQCDDGMDNDHDLLVDMADPGCLSRDQDDERHDQRSGIGGGREYIRTTSSSSFSSSVRSSSSRSSARPQAHGVRVSIQAGFGMVQPGETVPVRILVHNRSQQTADSVTVRFTYDPLQLSVTNMGWGMVRGAGAVEWTLDVQPDQTRLITLDATVLSVPAGTSIVASVRAQGYMDAPIASLVLPVAVQLPQTGAGPFTGALEDTSRFLSPLHQGTSAVLLLLGIGAMTGMFGGSAALARRASRKP
ncbi:MAG: hypothetical protein WCV62_05630 [Candidatus Peribacteraceae bacterium]|jgi:uncharacterized repeat protein (TIGR01451 family)